MQVVKWRRGLLGTEGAAGTVAHRVVGWVGDGKVLFSCWVEEGVATNKESWRSQQGP